MNNFTCVVIGGGHAGIHAIKAIQKNVGRKRSIRILLVDPNPYHVKKVLLFKPAVEKMSVKIPWKQILPSSVEIIQGYVTEVNPNEKFIQVQSEKGEERIAYNTVVIAVGSSFQQMDSNKGGIPLSSPENAASIYKQWNENLRLARKVNSPEEKRKLMTATVVGAGISGIETSAALAEQMKQKAIDLGLNHKEVNVLLINSNKELFHMGPTKLRRKLEDRIIKIGVRVWHNSRVRHESDGIVELNNGQQFSSGLCIWTTGLVPNPMLSTWNIPLTPDGRVFVDESYRVVGLNGMYSIGDCTRITDPRTGREDQMTCKEATIQARRLGKIMKADILQKRAPIHKTPLSTYCFGLGDKQGLVWVKLFTINIYLSGKIGYWIRKITWDIASLVK